MSPEITKMILIILKSLIERMNTKWWLLTNWGRLWRQVMSPTSSFSLYFTYFSWTFGCSLVLQHTHTNKEVLFLLLYSPCIQTLGFPDLVSPVCKTQTRNARTDFDCSSGLIMFYLFYLLEQPKSCNRSFTTWFPLSDATDFLTKGSLNKHEKKFDACSAGFIWGFATLDSFGQLRPQPDNM